MKRYPPKRHPLTELPPSADDCMVSDGSRVFIAWCRTFNPNGKPTKADWWCAGGQTGRLKWWAPLPRP